jgi:surface antigen
VLVWGGRRRRCRRRLYNDSGTAALRLCRLQWQARPTAIKPIVAILSLMAVSMAASGCSYQLASLVSTDQSAATGTINPSAKGSSGTSSKASSRAFSQASSQAELDLAYARAAAAEALAHGSRDASLPWQNPHSGARGNITPLATSYSEAGTACRDFLASYVHGESQDWLEGAACRTASGAWEVRRLKPLKSS